LRINNKLIIFLSVIFTVLIVFIVSVLSTQENEDYSFGLNFNQEAYENLEWAISPKLFRRDVEPLPVKVDMSGRIPEAGDQGEQNSCVGWAVGYAYRSYQKLREDNRRWDYEDESLCSPSFIYNTLSILKAEKTESNINDTGASVEEAMMLLRDYGCLPVSVMPYDESDNTIPPPEGYDDLRESFAIPSYQRLTEGFGDFSEKDLYQIKAALAGDEEMEGVPVEMSILVDPFWSKYITDRHESNNNEEVRYTLNGIEAEGVYRNYKRNKAYGHAVLIAGYDDEYMVEYEDKKSGETITEKGAFRILNSWGKEWSDEGYFWMTYKAAKLNGMEAYRIGKNPDLPDIDAESSDEIGAITVEQAISLRATVEKELFGSTYLVEQKVNYDDMSGFFTVDYNFVVEDKFKLFVTFNDEYSVYVVNITPDGRIRDLFPYPDEENVSTWVFSGHEYSFPIRDGEVYTFKPDGPVGRELYVILISDRQLTSSDVISKKRITNISTIGTIEGIKEQVFPKIQHDRSVQIYPVVLNTDD
jgi:hypothetical protein